MSVAESIAPELFQDWLKPDERPSILIAEDQARLRERLVSQVLGLGIVPMVAMRGSEAVRIAGAARPDLLLLDGLLPDMHGFEVARFVRHVDSSYRPRIAIVTGIYKGIRYENEARLKFGVDDYIVKPVAADALVKIVWNARRTH